jgi:hypothetical protein
MPMHEMPLWILDKGEYASAGSLSTRAPSRQA